MNNFFTNVIDFDDSFAIPKLILFEIITHNLSQDFTI